MQDLEKLGRSLFEGPKGGELRKIASSDEGRALEQKLDSEQVAEAVRSGDAARMKALLQSVLSTEEGRALAEKLSKLGL